MARTERKDENIVAGAYFIEVLVFISLFIMIQHLGGTKKKGKRTHKHGDPPRPGGFNCLLYLFFTPKWFW